MAWTAWTAWTNPTTARVSLVQVARIRLDPLDASASTAGISGATLARAGRTGADEAAFAWTNVSVANAGLMERCGNRGRPSPATPLMRPNHQQRRGQMPTNPYRR